MKFLKLLNAQCERWLMLWLYAFIVIVICTEVVRRFGLDYSSVWGEEAARYAFVYLTWIGAAAAIKNRTHIRIDVIQNLLPPRGQAVLNVVASVAAIVLACFALYWSLQPVEVSFRYGSVTDGLRIVKAWFLISVPLGFSLVLFRAAQVLLKDLADVRTGQITHSSQKLFD